MSAPARGRIAAAPLLWGILVLAAAAIRTVDARRPADGRVRESWRECDYAAVARNFVREGMDILSPRIDWRGDGPGFAEMEFPVVPWTMAALDKAFGYSEERGRWLMVAASLLALGAFVALARAVLPPAGALAASAVFAFSPLAVRVSNSLQPESLMLCLLVAAVYAFLRWLEKDGWVWYGLALASTAAAVLVKLPAAHVGLLFLFLLLERGGPAGLKRLRVWLFGAGALLPGILWYAHAHRFWTVYGNSLGVSNESHWFGLDLLARPGALLRLVDNLARLETGLVFTPLGVLLAVAAVAAIRRSRAAREARGAQAPESRAARIGAFWLIAAAVFYAAALRTTGDTWAAYYHVASAPAAALLIGAGFVAMRKPRDDRSDYFNSRFAATAALLLAGVLGFEGLMIVRGFHPSRFTGLYSCAQAFKPLIPEGSLVLCSGGLSRDETGKPVAYNASYMFFWLDRKGFSIPADRYSLEAVGGFTRRGARFFVLEKEGAAAPSSDFVEGLKGRASLAAECPEAYLFKLDETRPPGSGGPLLPRSSGRRRC